jgi:hypothetical protein
VSQKKNFVIDAMISLTVPLFLPSSIEIAEGRAFA